MKTRGYLFEEIKERKSRWTGHLGTRGEEKKKETMFSSSGIRSGQFLPKIDSPREKPKGCLTLDTGGKKKKTSLSLLKKKKPPLRLFAKGKTQPTKKKGAVFNPKKKNGKKIEARVELGKGELWERKKKKRMPTILKKRKGGHGVNRVAV